MAALDWITVEGFKSIKRIERLALEPINIVIGSNGSGKSNLIGVFSFLREIRCGRLREYVIRAGGADKILHFGSRMTPALMMRISFGGEINQYEISLTTTSGDELSPLGEAVYFRDKNRYEQPYGEVLVARSSGEAAISTTTSRITRYVREHFDSWRVYHFRDTSSTSPIKKTADVDDNRFLRHDGGNLAAFLYFLRQKHEDSYDLIRRTVRLVAPLPGGS